MLSIRNLHAFYGSTPALFGIDLSLAEGEVLSLMGRNGMGKTTTVRAIMGAVKRSGEVRFDGGDLGGVPTARIAQRGIGVVPEGRRIFPNLSVIENLSVVAANRRGVSDPWTVERVLALFPGLAARRGSMGSVLSGGEQQMLAVGRALMTNPKLVILDEATEGLAPLIRDQIWQAISALKTQGQSIIVIDKHLDQIERIADRHVVLERGRVAWRGDTPELARDRETVTSLIGL
jgi:branched-chain amino acid transport system ATP-binding protein